MLKANKTCTVLMLTILLTMFGICCQGSASIEQNVTQYNKGDGNTFSQYNNQNIIEDQFEGSMNGSYSGNALNSIGIIIGIIASIFTIVGVSILGEIRRRRGKRNAQNA